MIDKSKSVKVWDYSIYRHYWKNKKEMGCWNCNTQSVKLTFFLFTYKLTTELILIYFILQNQPHKKESY